MDRSRSGTGDYISVCVRWTQCSRSKQSSHNGLPVSLAWAEKTEQLRRLGRGSTLWYLMGSIISYIIVLWAYWDGALGFGKDATFSIGDFADKDVWWLWLFGFCWFGRGWRRHLIRALERDRPDLRSHMYKIRDLQVVGVYNLMKRWKCQTNRINSVASAQPQSQKPSFCFDLAWWPDLWWPGTEILTQGILFNC